MNSEEALSHIISSARYWSSTDTDPFTYPQLPLSNAFNAACWHVMDSHHYPLTVDEIRKAKNILKLPICNIKPCKFLECRIGRK